MVQVFVHRQMDRALHRIEMNVFQLFLGLKLLFGTTLRATPFRLSLKSVGLSVCQLTSRTDIISSEGTWNKF